MRNRAWILALALASGAAAAAAQETPPPPQGAPYQETVVVSATKTPTPETEVPGNVTVITGDELRREGVSNLSDALENVVGLDIGIGSDNGPTQPNIGLWGLKEFDSLLVMVDGVPVGGPFNPSLSQINLDQVDRIEIVKGPQGTLYGVSAFAGMIQVFTKGAEAKGGDVTLSGGSFSDGRGAFSANLPVSRAALRLFGSLDRAHGWQDRTALRDDRGGARLDAAFLGDGHLSLMANFSRQTQLLGSPMPVEPDTGATVEGFRADRNYEVGGARQDHRTTSLTAQLDKPLASGLALSDTLSFTNDDQISVRSFVDAGSLSGGQVASSGVALKPTERDLYDDLHLSAQFEAAGHHRLLAGAALTWGRTTARGQGFDFTVGLDPVAVPQLSDVPAGDHRSFTDRRTFFGVYANDEWTPFAALTVTAGARFDTVSESLFAQQQEVGAPQADVSRDSRSDGQWSGGIAALARAIDGRPGALNAVHFYGAVKSNFKPAAPNLSEAEQARILEPERTRSGELGVKTRWLEHQLSFDLSVFHMMFENLVVSIQGPDGNPELVNAGEERFQGMEIEAGYHPSSLPDVSLSGGYAHHDARYVHFTFVDPDLGLVDAGGNRLELTARDMWNLRATYAPAAGLGVWAAVRHQGHRPFDKLPGAYMPPFYEWDSGLSWSAKKWTVSLVGRNLGDSRHYVAESEIGDAQLYVAPPRRFLAQVTMEF